MLPPRVSHLQNDPGVDRVKQLEKIVFLAYKELDRKQLKMAS